MHKGLHIPVMLVLCFSVLAFCRGFAQAPLPDTVYYNKTWEICEPPVAAYYRTCTLHKGKDVYFTGAFTDYTIAHRIVSEGRYDSAGYRSGLFTYYYPNGEISKQGKFANNEMSELWRYYRYDGTLYFAGTFLNSYEVTPVYIYDWLSDSVLLSNGTGSFSIYTDQYPDVFPGSDCIVSGQVYQGVRDGNWSYFSHDSSFLIAYEKYHLGEFLGNLISDNVKKEQRLLCLEPKETRITSAFAYDDVFIVYGDRTLTVDHLVRFLNNHVTPSLSVHCTSYNNNLIAYSFVIKDLLLYSFAKPDNDPAFNGTELKSFGVYDKEVFENKYVPPALLKGYTAILSIKNETVFKLNRVDKQIRLHMHFRVNKDGTLSDLSIDGMFPDDIKKNIVYRLSRLKGLVANDSNTYTDLYLYSVPGQIKHLPVTDFYLSYYDRSNYR